MAQKQKIFIPTFISSIDFKPARVLPHVYFYNGLKESDSYFIEGYASGSTSSVTQNTINQFPYFDNYSGNTPSTSSYSLLFNNETAPYGEMPTGSLYSEYWETYVNLLYNPKTRLFDCSAIIPLADYFKMELNDIVEWRGNYYHLRAINNYNLSNGECQLQLLGPVIGDVIANQLPGAPCTFDFAIEDYTASFTTQYTMSMAPEVGATSTATYGGVNIFTISSTGSGSVSPILDNTPIVFSASGDSVWPSNSLLEATASLNGTQIYAHNTTLSSSVITYTTSSKEGDVFSWDVKTYVGVTPPPPPTSSVVFIEDCDTGTYTWKVETISGVVPSIGDVFAIPELPNTCYVVTNLGSGSYDIQNVEGLNRTDCTNCAHVPSTCREYTNASIYEWYGHYYDCQAGQWVNYAYITPGQSVCSGVPSSQWMIKLSGPDLSVGFNCTV